VSDKLDSERNKMKTYNTLQKLVTTTRCHYATYTEFGWVARRTAKNATHRLHFIFSHGQLDRNQVVAESL
jgi:hypothetical protein